MPARNSIKIYIANSFYHVYNRGVEKRITFQNEQDYLVFLNYLKEALLPPDPNSLKIIFILRGQSFEALRRPVKNYCDEITLCAYCLMPNHFHLLVKQKSKESLEGFMRSIMTRYSMYFNKKYDRVGSLFQGRYKAVSVANEAYLLHLSRYIHTNPYEYTKDLETAFSSYANYVGNKKTSWTKPEEILKFFNGKVLPEFKKTVSYKNFVENPNIDSLSTLQDLVLE